MGFFDGSGSQGGQPQQPQDTSGRSTAGMILGLLGGVTGSGILSGLGGMFNNEARLKFLDAQRPRLLKLAQDEGIIDQKKADFLQAMPLEAAMPDLHDINQQLFAQKAQRQLAPQPFYNQGTGQLEWHTPREGMSLGKGIVTPGMYNQQQAQAARQAAAEEHKREYGATQQRLEKNEQEREREFGITKRLQEANFGATMAERQSNDAFRRMLADPRYLGSKASIEETARETAKDAAQQLKPFGQVMKDQIPFKNIGGHDVPIPTTIPYGRISREPGVFYVPKTDVTNGTFSRLTLLPKITEQLNRLAPSVLGSGGILGYGRKGLLGLKGDPAKAAYDAATAAAVETATSSLSRRVSQPQINMWKEALTGRFATPDSVKWATEQLNNEAAAMKQSYMASGNAMPGGAPSSLGGASISGGEDSPPPGFVIDK